MGYDYCPLYELLRKNKISLTAFRKRAKLTPADMWALETGSILPIETIYRICQLLVCDIRDIFNFSDGTRL